MRSKLYDQPTYQNDPEPEPGRAGYVFPKSKFAKKNADQRKHTNINAEEPRKIQFDRIDDQAVRTEHGETDQNQNSTSAPQPGTNDSVAPTSSRAPITKRIQAPTVIKRSQLR